MNAVRTLDRARHQVAPDLTLTLDKYDPVSGFSALGTVESGWLAVLEEDPEGQFFQINIAEAAEVSTSTLSELMAQVTHVRLGDDRHELRGAPRGPSPIDTQISLWVVRCKLAKT